VALRILFSIDAVRVRWHGERMMRCNPWRWLWGLIPVAMIGWVAVQGHRESIERDLTERVRTILDRNGLTWATVRFTGRDGVLSGRSMEDGGPEKAVESALATFGVRVVDSQAGIVEKVEKFVWSASREGSRVVIEGYVPSERARSALGESIRSALPSAAIDDKAVVARGAPAEDVWLGAAGHGLRMLAQLRQGQMTLEQAELSIAGEALDGRAYESVKTALAGPMPKGSRLRQEAVLPPAVKPYVWSARLGGGQLLLTGAVPGEKARAGFRSIAQRSLAGVKIEDRTSYGSGAPEGFSAAVETTLREMAQLEEAAVELRDGRLSIAGVAETQDKAERVKAALKALPTGIRVTEQITYKTATPKPAISPYVTALAIEGDALTLAGHVPSDGARQSLLGLVRQRLAGLRVIDRLEVGPGEPAGWQPCLEVAVGSLQTIGNGRATLADARLDVVGVVDSEERLQRITEDVRDAASGSCTGLARLTLDTSRQQPSAEQRLRAEEEDRRRAEEDQRARAAAAAAEEERRRAQVEADQRARAAAADEERRRAQAEAEARSRAAAAEDDRRRAQAEAEARARSVASAAEEERRRAAEAADEGRRRAEIEARARAAAAAEAEIRRREQEARSRPVPAIADPVRRQEAQDCQDLMQSTAREGTILFDFAKANIDPRSFATLNRVAAVANRCPAFKIDIEGHTDIDGAPDRNQRLSERRANAVRDYLVKAGVAGSRLRAVGYGQDRAVAPNDTPKNKALNRRIEFSVTGE
jgi:OOP family OmpA-OmpF porin